MSSGTGLAPHCWGMVPVKPLLLGEREGLAQGEGWVKVVTGNPLVTLTLSFYPAPGTCR